MSAAGFDDWALPGDWNMDEVELRDLRERVVSTAHDPWVNIGSPPAWTMDAVCAQTDPEVFYPPDEPEYRTSTDRSRVEEARIICRQCPVRPECLEYALENREPWGVWGGLTASERARILAKRDRAA